MPEAVRLARSVRPVVGVPFDNERHAPVPSPARRMPAPLAAAVLNRQHADATAEEILHDAILGQYAGGIALVSSFGADAAVLLHMVARIAPATPVLFVETGMLFPETLAYQRALAGHLGLRDVRVIRPEAADLAARDPGGMLHRDDTTACCDLRKSAPLARALDGFDAWITGRKRAQAATRAAMPLFEVEDVPGSRRGRVKVNPLAGWTADRLRAYRKTHALPVHPLVSRGYPSIGCAPCTTPVAAGEDPRAGRWRGQAKTECGIQFDGTRWVRGPV
jgi:phosphoadenosine phosphosulfate reductase